MSIWEFAKRVGIVAGALVAVVTLSNALGSVLMRQAMVPVTEEIQRQVALERSERITADLQLSADRLLILDILEYPPGPERSRRIERARNQWER